MTTTTTKRGKEKWARARKIDGASASAPPVHQVAFHSTTTTTAAVPAFSSLFPSRIQNDSTLCSLYVYVSSTALFAYFFHRIRWLNRNDDDDDVRDATRRYGILMTSSQQQCVVLFLSFSFVQLQLIHAGLDWISKTFFFHSLPAVDSLIQRCAGCRRRHRRFLVWSMSSALPSVSIIFTARTDFQTLFNFEIISLTV